MDKKLEALITEAARGLEKAESDAGVAENDQGRNCR